MLELMGDDDHPGKPSEHDPGQLDVCADRDSSGSCRPGVGQENLSPSGDQMTKLLLLLLFVLTAGCAPTEDHFWVTGDATDREVEIMQSATDAWCETTSGAWCTTIDREPGDNIIAIVPVGVLVDKDNALHTTHSACQQWHEIRITDHRERTTWENDLYWLTVHELGHAYGLEHIKGTVMSKGYDRTELPTKEFSNE